jgi:hypothetical protein
MATTKLQICKIALTAIGSKNTIQSLDEASTEARNCTILYDLARDTVLEDLDWPFASAITTLALAGTAPTGWEFQYAWPNLCIVPREIVQPDPTQDPVLFEVRFDETHGRVIVTNEEDASLRYTRKVDEPGNYTPNFVNALSLQLAYRLALPLTRDQRLANELGDRYAIALAHAKALSANVGVRPGQAQRGYTRNR